MSNSNCNIGNDVVGSRETRRIARCSTVDIKLLRPTTMIRLGETQVKMGAVKFLAKWDYVVLHNR